LAASAIGEWFSGATAGGALPTRAEGRGALRWIHQNAMAMADGATVPPPSSAAMAGDDFHTAAHAFFLERERRGVALIITKCQVSCGGYARGRRASGACTGGPSGRYECGGNAPVPSAGADQRTGIRPRTRPRLARPPAGRRAALVRTPGPQAGRLGGWRATRGCGSRPGGRQCTRGRIGEPR
jgi:hypothetical protein